jgi:hypothetical protein
MAMFPTGIDWGRILAATGQGLMQAGTPGGNFGAGLMQGAQFYDATQDRKRARSLEELRIDLLRQEQEAQRAANTKAAEQQRVTMDYINSLPPEQQGFAMAFPDQAAELIRKQQFPDATKAAEAPTIKDFYEGSNVVQKQWDPATKAWVKVGEGARWAPSAPAAAGEYWEPYIDPKSGRTGQKNTRTGKIDWDPGNTMMVQTGTDANGNPIYDFVSTPAGKPPSEANIQAGMRGTLIDSAIKNIRDVTGNLGAKISPLRMAAADTLGEKGPMGAYGANVLRTDDEKKYSAAISKGVEGLVAAITGAGVAKDQFPRIQNLIPGPTDSPEVVNWKLDQLIPVLDTLVAGSGPLALTKKGGPGATPKAPADMTDDELLKELGQ